MKIYRYFYLYIIFICVIFIGIDVYSALKSKNESQPNVAPLENTSIDTEIRELNKLEYENRTEDEEHKVLDELEEWLSYERSF